MLTIQASGTESLWDEILPAEVTALPHDLARLDDLLCDPTLLSPIAVRWERLPAESGASLGRGRPTIAMETYVRLMIVKHRCGWGYETLMREVSDSIHLRRFCRIGMTERVPGESTVRKLTRRLGAEVVHEITRELISKARRVASGRPRKYARIRAAPGGACVGRRPARHPASPDRAAPTSSGCPRILAHVQCLGGWPARHPASPLPGRWWAGPRLRLDSASSPGIRQRPPGSSPGGELPWNRRQPIPHSRCDRTYGDDHWPLQSARRRRRLLALRELEETGHDHVCSDRGAGGPDDADSAARADDRRAGREAVRRP